MESLYELEYDLLLNEIKSKIMKYKVNVNKCNLYFILLYEVAYS